MKTTNAQKEAIMISASRVPIFLIIILTICGLSFITLNTPSCTKKETITEVVYDTTTQSIVICQLTRLTSTVSIYSDPLAHPDSSDVIKYCNGSSTVFGNKQLFPTYLGFVDSVENSFGVAYSIVVLSNVGDAIGEISLPDSTHFIQPIAYDTLSIGDINILWRSSQGADFYWLILSISAIDSIGNLIENVRIDSFITDSSYIIPSSFFDSIPASFYLVYADIYPYAGQEPVPGNDGNMSGSLSGFIFAKGNGDFNIFFVGTPVRTAENRIKRNKLEFKRKIISVVEK